MSGEGQVQAQASVARAHWSSRWGFFLVTVGSAVGLGNIWKFPYMTGSNGGSAFVLVYLACILIIGVPLLMAETLLGRRGQASPVGTMRALVAEAGAQRFWVVIGYVGIIGSFLILAFYSVVAGWVLEYTWQAAGGFAAASKEVFAQAFADLLANPARLIFWHSLFMAMTAVVVLGGVTAGIERANKIMMPGLFAILLFLVGYGAYAADLPAAWRFLFHFDASALNRGVLFAAMGHAFFTLSLGMGAIITYGSYLDRDTSIPKICLQVAVADTVVALLAGLSIFSVVFAQGLAPEAGPGLLLQTLPLAFSQMPGGQAIGFLFFVLVVFAAWTSSISLLEPSVTLLVERFAMGRRQAVLCVTLAIWLLGVAVAFSFNDWKGFSLFGLGLFDLLDTATTKFLMPLAGLLIALFTAWVMRRADVAEEIGLRGAAFVFWYRVLAFVSPVAILIIFLHVLGVLG
ncbi:sodium-dependent transporter [Azonexus sp.]|uniref:sodium-dependent transporter n=1 Tax=Azonexus sp. TaxID=1872668 RepID=UPI0039E54B41